MAGELSSAVYIDDRVKTERWVYRNSIHGPSGRRKISDILTEEPVTLQTNVQSLLDVCSQIYICHSGQSFATTLAELNDRSGSDCTPIFAFIDIDSNSEAVALRRRDGRDSTGSLGVENNVASLRGFTFSSESADSYGVQLLALLSSDLQLQDGPKLIIPIALLRSTEEISSPKVEGCSNGDLPIISPTQHSLLARCLDAGAVDVLCQPLPKTRVPGLMIHAYRVRRAAQKEMSRFMSVKKSRKQSWVGVHNEKPYAYLRETMVSKLMKSICNPEDVIEEFQDGDLTVSAERKLFVERAIGEWEFPAHDLSEDELVLAACSILSHTMTMPEVESWKLTDGELRTFLLASRAAYNSFVLYHNFRHAVDVMQSVFWILLRIGAIPPINTSNPVPPVSKSMVATLISPFDALTLLISAIGHDVGHPGVNNVFLVKLNAPLAQLYNDSSVLEAFHCAAFSQILRRHWPVAFNDTNLRKLLISSILATDMGVHFKFMARMTELQRKYHENEGLEGWSTQDRDTYKSLMCGLIIKCADISNVARPWHIAERWTNILQEEFAHQGEMEKGVGMETALFGGPPELGNILKLATGQINFMTIFALPLFEGVADLCPQMNYTVEQIKLNRSTWQEISDREKRRNLDVPGIDSDEQRSPRSLSPAKSDTYPVSAVQENDIGTTEGLNAQITLDQPPDDLISAPSPVTQKKIAEGQVDLTQTTVAGFRTFANNDDNSHSSESPSGAGDSSNTGDSSDATIATHNGIHYRGVSCSSTHASRPSSSYGIGRDTRTQSASTCANTVETPVSPATNATSFVTVDSSDEKDVNGSGLSSKSDVYPLDDDNHSRPSSSGLYAVSDRHQLESNGHYIPQKPRSFHQLEELSKPHHMMTAILGNALNSRGSSPIEYDNSKMDIQNTDDESSIPYNRTIPRKKSRLRLAFWRRKTQYQQQADNGY
ncbi:putative high affinity cAMP phosphodiesterase [Talaromyces proteolyticus]|uniref:Phosphodiesterase n=1 Tax=Talaromyces proteolyticus TaxID=1131652 RepID=A0AAD4Q2P7_9EURO|nr:putative high affinity cAMP phosphodiesterase [Talaromyces proteolyticus]KAH8700611.1 putative high affinity cAMP phosphodiesterase [Talaromyces proteolyticus]